MKIWLLILAAFISPVINAKKLQLYIPKDYLSLVKNNTLGNFLEIEHSNIFLAITSLSYFYAAKNSPIQIITSIDECVGPCAIRDFFADYPRMKNMQKTKNISWWVISDSALRNPLPDFNYIYHGFWILNRNLNESPEELHTKDAAMLHDSINDKKRVISSLGMVQQLVPKDVCEVKPNKTILIDEIYPAIDVDPGQSKHFWMAFNKTMEIATILQEKHGFELVSFVGRNQKHLDVWRKQYPKVRVHSMKKLKYGDYLKIVRKATFYFSHTFETYGMPYFEALQHGMPVFLFSEHAPSFLFSNFGNSVQFSLKESAILSAERIADYVLNVYSVQQCQKIKDNAEFLFSAEKFGKKLIKYIE